MNVQVNNLHRSFGSNHVLRGLSFELVAGDLVGLIGPSGGGKSVLLKALAGIETIDGGTVTGAQPNSVSLMFQEGALFDSLNALDNVAFPLVQGRVPVVDLLPEERERTIETAYAVLCRVGLSAAHHKMPGQLSGGMRRRLSLARALVTRPQLLLLDDPTAGLDPVSAHVIMDLIAALHAEYLPTTIIVSHDLRRLLPMVKRTMALFDGQIVFDGALSQLRGASRPEVQRFVACRYDLDAGEHQQGLS